MLSSIHFSPTPLTLAICITAFAAVLVLSWLSWKRSPHPKRTAILEVMRLLATTTVVLLLWQPEWRTVIQHSAKPRIAILWDDSKSMGTLDAALPPELDANGGKGGVVTRADWVQKALASGLWKPLEANGRNEVLRLPFATPATGATAAASGTDLYAPISELLEREDRLRAVILLSDGDPNTGQPPVAAAQKLRLRGVPLFAIPVGSPARLPDIDLMAVTAPSYGIVGENVQIPFRIHSSLGREVRTLVRLRDGQGRERTKDIVLPPNGDTYDSILWKLEKEGSATLELSLPVADGELIDSNNTRKFTISGRPEKIHVLVIDSQPRWEYRYLRNALSRDPGVELSCLLFHPQLGMGGGPDYIQQFPSKLEELAKYDVIFIGDVGVEAGQLTKEQCAMIRGLVENQASGVVFLPGSRGHQFSLLESELGELIPVQLDATHKQGITDSIASPLTLTSEGRGSLLTMLGDTEEENPQIWKRLPGFYWYAPVIKAKGGTEVLAVHSSKRGKYGYVPLIVTRLAGNGKVLFMGIDSAWRWRRGVEDLYHYRFWGQVARWMSYQRNMAAGQNVRLYFTPERPAPGDTVTLHANASNANGAPLQNGSVSIDITAPDGKAQRIDLQQDNAAWGSFSGRFRIDQPGEWKLRAAASNAPDKAIETTLLAQGTELETIGLPNRPEILEEMTRVARGRIVPSDRLADLMRELDALPEPQPLERRIPLGSHWATLAALIALLGLFWAGRKLNGAF